MTKQKPILQLKRIENTFDAYCKKIVKNEAKDIKKSKSIKQSKEVLFSDLSEIELKRLSHFDKHDTIFAIIGLDVVVQDDTISELLEQLNEYKRTIILLSYFLDMSDREIAEHLHTVRRTVADHRSKILNEMRNMLEEDTHE